MDLIPLNRCPRQACLETATTRTLRSWVAPTPTLQIPPTHSSFTISSSSSTPRTRGVRGWAVPVQARSLTDPTPRQASTRTGRQAGLSVNNAGDSWLYRIMAVNSRINVLPGSDHCPSQYTSIQFLCDSVTP